MVIMINVYTQSVFSTVPVAMVIVCTCAVCPVQ